MIAIVTEADLADLLPLMRGYCDFYGVAPSDDDLLDMSHELIRSPALDGIQLIARDASGRALGFATVFWTWSTLSASRIGVMNDLFVSGRLAEGASPMRSSTPAPSAPGSAARRRSTGRPPTTTSAHGRSTSA